MKHATLIALVALMTLDCATHPAPGETVVAGPDADAVVVLHGLARSPVAMNAIETELLKQGYQVYNLEYSSLGCTMNEIVAEVRAQVTKLPILPEQKIHFVGHSLGGIVIRALLAQPVRDFDLGNVVLIAAPNKGSEMADHYRESLWLSWLLPVALELGTDPGSFPNQLPPPNYPVGVIAGTTSYRSTGHLIKGVDDGVVGVDSTKLEQMSDFIVVNANHSRLRRYNPVLSQITSFLKRGTFVNPSPKML